MNKKILFIEDDPGLQDALKESLKHAPYDLFSAFDGEEGFRQSKELQPDLILLDLILPKISGQAVLSDLKKDSKTKDIPVIVLTNLEDPKHIEEVLRLGANAYLVKTQYTLQELKKKIDEFLVK